MKHAIRLLALLIIVTSTVHLQAQYFGRNKVQYEQFEFKVLKTDHFDIYYYFDDEQTVEDIARQAERWYDRLSTLFEHELPRKPIVIYADHPDFQQTTTTGGLIGEGTGGFTDSFKNRIVMPLTGSYADNDHVLGHEMVHVFQYDIAQTISRSGTGGRFQLQQLPLWMIEGLAEYLSQGRIDAQTAMWMRDAVAQDDLPDFTTLSRDLRYTPYQYGQAVWAYVAGRWGDRAAVQTFIASGVLGPEAGFSRVLDMTPDELFEAWHAATREAFAPVISARFPPGYTSRPLLTSEITGGRVNIAPSISPDGSQVAFLSTRDLFSLDLFLADARTGEVSRKLISADADPHFDALRFIDSSGTWSPDGRKFALSVFEDGNNTIAILDVESRAVERRIRVGSVGSISNPAWSPDGETIAFSGMRGGISDLYLLDLESNNVTQLTNDRYADLQPAWAPNGRMIAFVTDRGPGTDLGDLDYHQMRLAIYDLDSNNVQVVSLFNETRHSNPQFSPNGSEIFFIADPDGVANVYVYDLGTGSVGQLTNVQTGVTGITDLSPAISVAASTGDLMYSVLEDARWNIYGIQRDELRRTSIAQNISGRAEASEILPPVEAIGDTAVASYLSRPTRGLPSEDVDYAVGRYFPKLSLDYIGPPAIGLTSDEFGTGLSGAISAYFSDVLGQHQLGVALQTGNTSSSEGTSFAEQIGGQLFYLNQSHRFNWGTVLMHVPYVDQFTTGVDRNVDLGGGVRGDVVQQLRRIVTIDELSLIAQYPFTQTRRFETEVGYTRYQDSRDLIEYTLVGGRIADIQVVDSAEIDPLDYYHGSIALVGDSSAFGFVSPVRGTRYRLEAEVNEGDINFTTGLADYRRYVFFRPVTFAVRAIHFGRYGDGAEDNRLSDLYLGRTSLVRGYDDFSASECTFSPANPEICPEFERLLGSKIGVVNLEVRAPLFGNEEFGLFQVEFLPTEMYAFADGGVAWTEDESPTFRFDQDSLERIPVFSAGVGLRMVLGGYLPLNFYYAFPFQRPAEEGGKFGFAIQVGW
ncbi:MAG: BamA/TamA family outer membrane protein [Acidobacteria bacterium]|nr:BamA/TamA family outer membrane protein [Acidobacteriota bacterium]